MLNSSHKKLSYNRNTNVFQGLLWCFFVVILIVLFFSTQTQFGTANYPRIYKINRICIVLFIFLVIILNKYQIKVNKNNIFAYLVVLVPQVTTFILSLFQCIILNRISVSDMITFSLQPLLVCMLAITSCIMFGRKAINSILVAAFINYTIYIVSCIFQYGPLSIFQAGTDTPASRFIEVHEITFIFGLFILYFAMSDFFKNSKKKKWGIFFATIFCLLGFKRILVVAILGGILLYFILKNRKNCSWLIICLCIGIGLSLLWVYICSSWDLLTGISFKYGIDLKGRNWIYSNFYPYYDFSIKYVGAGIGYVQTLIYQLSTMQVNGYSIGLHNEFMRLFIELGCIPYILYFVLLLPVMALIINRRFGYKSALFYSITWIVTLLSCATDNLMTYPNYMMVLWVIIIRGIIENSSKTATKQTLNKLEV